MIEHMWVDFQDSISPCGTDQKDRIYLSWCHRCGTIRMAGVGIEHFSQPGNYPESKIGDTFPGAVGTLDSDPGCADAG